MIELIFVVCLTTASNECKTLNPSYGISYPHVMACMREGMIRAVQWQETHPAWTIHHWKCEHETI